METKKPPKSEALQRENALTALAENGFFFDRELDPTEFDLSTAMTRKPFTVRKASTSDVDSLVQLESICWHTMEVSREEIEMRIARHPAGQYVAVLDGELVGVMYTQRIASKDVLFSSSFPAQGSLHDPQGLTLQLLGVAVLPTHSGLQIANTLRHLAKNVAQCAWGVTEVVAVTRCATAHSSEAEFEAAAAALADPILQFHGSAGAQFVSILRHYRDSDAANFHHAVLISYAKEKGASRPQSAQQRRDAVRLSAEQLCLCLSAVCGAAVSPSAASLSTPFMQLGLDSLKMMELRGALVAQLGLSADTVYSTVLFDFPTPRALLAHINGGIESALSATPRDANTRQCVSVCGVSCRLPNGADDPDAFFEMLCEKKSFVRDIPQSWRDKTKARCAGLLDGDTASAFDPQFFGVSHEEASWIDPHQRLLLEVVHEALCDAGVVDANRVAVKESMRDKRVGVFVGLCNNEWIRSFGDDDARSPYLSTAVAQSAAANRISFLFGLTGPSMVVDTACSSSLAAVHVALNSLRNDDCDVAVVAGADLLLSPFALQIREAAGMLTSDCKNKSFGCGADGYIRSEGAVAVVLVREDAEDLWTRSYGSILGSALNQDGRSASFTAPNGSAQRALLESALSAAGVEPSQVDYLEAHGTGTALGDPIEFNAIKSVFLSSAAPDLVVGAAKSAVGHLEGAAGLVGLLKALLVLDRGVIPPNQHCAELNPLIDTQGPRRAAVFPREVLVRQCEVAGVSSFGSGGTNAHVVLRRSTRRGAPRFKANEKPRAAFMFSGQGTLQLDVVCRLRDTQPLFVALLEDCSRLCSLSAPLGECLTDAQLNDDPVASHMVLFAFEVALARIFEQHGVSASAVCGHSFGEFAAAVVSGALDLEVAARLVHIRAVALLDALGARLVDGAMAALRAERARVTEAILRLGLQDRVCVAAENGGASNVVSGERAALDLLVKDLDCSHKYLNVPYPYHSRLLAAAAERFRERAAPMLAALPPIDALPVRFVSCLTGEEIDPNRLRTAEYWRDQMLSTVRFAQCVDELAGAAQCDVAVEIGPDATLTALAAAHLVDTAPQRTCAFVSSFDKTGVALDRKLARLQDVMCQQSRGGRFALSYSAQRFPWRKTAFDAVSAQARPEGRPQGAERAQSAVMEVFAAFLGPARSRALSLRSSIAALGVDSLGAISIRNKLAAVFALDSLDMSVVLQHATVGELADTLSALLSSSSSTAAVSVSADEVSNSQSTFATTSLQQSILYHHLADPEHAAFVETFRWRASSALNIERFFRAWTHTIRALPMLRTVFDAFAVPVASQTVLPADELLREDCRCEDCEWFRAVDLTAQRDLSGAALEDAVTAHMLEQRMQLKDLTSAPLLCVSVLSTRDACVVLLSVHHLLVDGVSMQHVMRCVQSSYDALARGASCTACPGEGVSFHRVVQAEERVLSDSKQRHALADFWRRRLASHADVSPLLGGKPWSTALAEDEVVRVQRSLSVRHSRFASVAAELGCSAAAVYHGLFALFLGAYCRDDRVVYGSTVYNRRDSEVVVGPALNTVPSYRRIDPTMSAQEFFRDVQRDIFDSLNHGALPLSEILKLSPAKDSRLFSIIFDYQTSSWDCPLNDAPLVFEQLVDRIGCPLSLRVLVKDGETVELAATSESPFFPRAAMHTMLRGFERLLCRFVETDSRGASVAALQAELHFPRLVESEFRDAFPLVEARAWSSSSSAFDLDLSEEWAAELGAAVDAVIALFCIAVYRLCAANGLNVRVVRRGGERFAVPLRVSASDLHGGLLDLVAKCESLALQCDGACPAVVEGAPTLLKEEPLALFVERGESSLHCTLAVSDERVAPETRESICSYVSRHARSHFVRPRRAFREHAVVMDESRPVAGYCPDETFADLPLFHCLDTKEARPEDIAVVCYEEDDEDARNITFRQLRNGTSRLATSLLSALGGASAFAAQTSRRGARDCAGVVAVVMEKGWEQVAATLAVLRVGCAYLPMDAKSWPEHRVRQVLEISEAVAVLTQPRLLAEDGGFAWLRSLSVPVLAVSSAVLDAPRDDDEAAGWAAALSGVGPQSTEQLAYLIYTSGSTGVPKGVCCHHRGAMNTIQDLNERFGVSAEDRVLALSSLSFDLSVYDVFGVLSAGGAVVIPAPSAVSPPNPEEWLELLVAERVTVWNTVPAFMELLASHLELVQGRLPACLRVVFMSGDWIPTTLPGRIRALSDCSELRIVSMGGATEASIWSNIFELDPPTQNVLGEREREGESGSLSELEKAGVPPGWTSIPYGRPMRNQRMYILNERLEHCEAWVTGAIYIGGVGVAHGYYKNEERSKLQFVTHPVTGEALFRTGDLGRVRPGGLLEILGREDSQVKVNGFRIELGEIEKTLATHGAVQSAVVSVHNHSLCAYVVLDGARSAGADAQDDLFAELRALCRQSLTEYMVPQHWMAIDEVPLSANGKVMRSKLPEPSVSAHSSRHGGKADLDEAPKTATQRTIREIFAAVLNVNEQSIQCESNTFFELGGNSLSAIQLLFALRKKFGRAPTIQELFRLPTVCALSTLYENTAEEQASSEITVSAVRPINSFELASGSAEQRPLFVFNPAGASALCYMALTSQFASARPVYGLDDGAVESGRDLAFSSIPDVARHCVAVMREIVSQRFARGGAAVEIDLAGWSYGGVVAAEVAKQLTLDGAAIVVRSVTMFDSPLRSAVVNKSEAAASPFDSETSIADDESAETMLRAEKHFRQCTTLLSLYHQRPKDEKPLRCAVLDVRPESSDYRVDVAALEELTSSEVQQKVVPGTHWTMLYGENAQSSAAVMQSFWSSLP